MKKSAIFIGLFLLCSCFSRPTMMTTETYAEVQVGTPIETVVAESGPPYSTYTKNGNVEYRYIEKVTTGNRLIYENHFTLFVQNGVVVGKTARQEMIPSYDLIYQQDPNHIQYP